MKALPTLNAIALLAVQQAKADETVPPRPEVQVLRDDVTQLQSRITQLETRLKAKGILPPPKAENPAAWIEIEVCFDKNGKTQIDDKPASAEDLKGRLAAIFQTGKFPEVKIVAPSSVSFTHVQTLLKTLGECGVPNVSFATRD